MCVCLIHDFISHLSIFSVTDLLKNPGHLTCRVSHSLDYAGCMFTVRFSYFFVLSISCTALVRCFCCLKFNPIDKTKGRVCLLTRNSALSSLCKLSTEHFSVPKSMNSLRITNRVYFHSIIASHLLLKMLL